MSLRAFTSDQLPLIPYWCYPMIQVSQACATWMLLNVFAQQSNAIYVFKPENSLPLTPTTEPQWRPTRNLSMPSVCDLGANSPMKTVQQHMIHPQINRVPVRIVFHLSMWQASQPPSHVFERAGWDSALSVSLMAVCNLSWGSNPWPQWIVSQWENPWIHGWQGNGHHYPLQVLFRPRLKKYAVHVVTQNYKHIYINIINQPRLWPSFRFGRLYQKPQKKGKIIPEDPAIRPSSSSSAQSSAHGWPCPGSFPTILPCLNKIRTVQCEITCS